jgi:hypothetical protein
MLPSVGPSPARRSAIWQTRPGRRGRLPRRSIDDTLRWTVRLLAVLVALASPLAAHGDYVLNGAGIGRVHSIYRVDDLGRPADHARIIGPSGEGFDALHVYWPSAIRVGQAIYVYATGHDKAGNLGLGLWISNDGVMFHRFGQVLAAEDDEGQIGMSHVVHDPDDAVAPFKLWYGSRYLSPPGRATEVRYATSTNGKNWIRAGTALTAAEADAPGGLQVDYVCKDDDIWRLLYGAAYDQPLKFRADEAVASTAGGAYPAPSFHRAAWTWQ